MTSKIKVDNITNQSDSNIVNKCGTTITLGASGDTINLASGASQTGFGRTGTVDWDTTAKTASFTAVSGNGYFVNTTSGAVTMTLPATPSAGDIVSLSDYTNTWQTNNVTVASNGSPIGGITADAVLSTEGQSVTFVYVDGTEGWKNVQDSTSNVIGNPYIQATGGTITTCGDFKIHTFTGPGTFCVSSNAICAAYQKVDYMVVAGGASGGNQIAGGGGAGGFRESYCSTTSGCYTASPLASPTSLPVSVTGYPITVGAGGAPVTTTTGPEQGPVGNPGSNSIFSTITSAGGGGGGGNLSGGCGQGGGSGGGAGLRSPVTSAGAGNTPPVSPPQGNNGGSANPGSPKDGGGGGGGATAVGANASDPIAGPGGAGATTSINGTPTTRAGGGGGGGRVDQSVPGGTGGTGGGGAGAPGQPSNPDTRTGSSATANTGGGGGGGGYDGGGCAGKGISGGGGSGIVIIRYKYQ